MTTTVRSLSLNPQAAWHHQVAQLTHLLRPCRLLGTNPTIVCSWEELAMRARFLPREMARLRGVSLRTLHRFFKCHNLQLGCWINQLRLKQAYHRLISGEQVKIVAYDLGYSELSNFSRAFKQAFGFAPSLISRNSGFYLSIHRNSLPPPEQLWLFADFAKAAG